MITISSAFAKSCGAVFRKILAKTPGRTFVLISGSHGIRLRCIGEKLIADVLLPSPAERLEAVLPLDVLTDATGRKNETVELNKVGTNIEARTVNGGVPRVRQVPLKAPTDAHHPAWPATSRTNSPRLRVALDEAMQSASKLGGRFAMDHVCLRGKTGEVIGTDGRQLLILKKFEFPWSGDVLISTTSIFGMRELQTADEVHVAEVQDCALFRIGDWTFAFPIARQARFPDFNQVIPKTEPNSTTWRVNAKAGGLLAAAIDKLPSEQDNESVTIDLGRTVAIRAKTNADAKPTELAVHKTAVSGSPIRLVSNRHYLSRALELGCDTFVVPGADKPIVGRGKDRMMVWVPLPSGGAIPPHANPIRVELGKAALGPTTVSRPIRKPSQKPARETKTAPTSSAPADSKSRWQGLFDAWTTLKSAIRESLREEPEWA